MAETARHKDSGWSAWNAKRSGKSGNSEPPRLDKATVKKSRAPGILDKAWGKVTKEINKGKGLPGYAMNDYNGGEASYNTPKLKGKMFVYGPQGTLVKVTSTVSGKGRSPKYFDPTQYHPGTPPTVKMSQVDTSGNPIKGGLQWEIHLSKFNPEIHKFHEVTPTQAKRIKTLEKRYNAASNTAYKKYGVI